MAQPCPRLGTGYVPNVKKPQEKKFLRLRRTRIPHFYKMRINNKDVSEWITFLQDFTAQHTHCRCTVDLIRSFAEKVKHGYTPFVGSMLIISQVDMQDNRKF